MTTAKEAELEFLDWKENVKADIQQDVKRALEQPAVPQKNRLICPGSALVLLLTFYPYGEPTRYPPNRLWKCNFEHSHRGYARTQTNLPKYQKLYEHSQNIYEHSQKGLPFSRRQQNTNIRICSLANIYGTTITFGVRIVNQSMCVPYIRTLEEYLQTSVKHPLSGNVCIYIRQ